LRWTECLFCSIQICSVGNWVAGHSHPFGTRPGLRPLWTPRSRCIEFWTLHPNPQTYVTYVRHYKIVSWTSQLVQMFRSSGRWLWCSWTLEGLPGETQVDAGLMAPRLFLSLFVQKRQEMPSSCEQQPIVAAPILLKCQRFVYKIQQRMSNKFKAVTWLLPDCRQTSWYLMWPLPVIVLPDRNFHRTHKHPETP